MANCFQAVLTKLSPGQDKQGVDGALLSILQVAAAADDNIAGADSFANAATTSLALLQGLVQPNTHQLLAQYLSDVERKFARGER